MANVNSILFLLFFLFFGLISFSQKSTDKLRKEQEKIEKSISNTKSLIEKTKSHSQTTLSELKLLDKQIILRESLIQNYDNQIKSNELKKEEKKIHIEYLEKELKNLKEQYKKLLFYAYKNRNKSGQLMYLFSSTSYNQALKRKKYLDKLVTFQKNQKKLIIQHQKLLNKEINELEKNKKQIVYIANIKKEEKQNIITDKEKQVKTLEKLKGDEQNLLSKLREEEAKRIQIKKQIEYAIQKELASKSSSTSKSTKKEKSEKKIIKEPHEFELNSSFENNKGRLPWPVSGGAITERYGKNPHPSIPNVFTNNNGVDFSVTKGANVRAVFDGEVSSVFNIPGAGKVVIIKHGNYRTVYSNLQEVYVSVGTKVNTKQSIGSLLVQDDESVSVSHFEIHQVLGSDVNRINPELWLSR